MQFSLVVIACLQALTLAHPHVASPEYDLILPRKNENGTNVTDHTDQSVPVFLKPCVCPAVICDPRMNAKSVSIYATNFRAGTMNLMCDCKKKQICQCKAQAALACSIKSEGTCPRPKDNVSAAAVDT